ncbi:deoxycytidine triphosphate deaminase [Ignicoccus pacificus DSM 13166]|uniref:dCTP deaminase n=1 Tax=Ignicoccus pacificus DSM 13166 TaxID=940294 RepID=A0A977KAK6_9CREN|nr:deoxycytidine triphosphate deaminase [Ignicoccus pacificus DSM 13166]
MILSDRGIKAYIQRGLMKIEPFDESLLSENGVDLRIGCEYARFKRINKVLDVTSEEDIEEYYERGDLCKEGGLVIKPYEHVLLHTLEVVRIPYDLVALVNLKSTLARLGLYIPPTVVDAGFEGQIVIEVIGSSFPVKLKAGIPFVHFILVRLDSPVERDYSVRGHYQGQRGIKLPKIPISIYDIREAKN